MVGRSASVRGVTIGEPRRAQVARAILILALVTLGTVDAEAQEQEPSGRGRIAGVVLDRSTGRPIQGVRVAIADVADLMTDLDGRFRSPELPPGVYSVEAARIGYRPVRIDSVEVNAGETATADLALEAAAMQLEGLEVTAEAVHRPSSDAALLRIRQAAPVVTDGISAETISRTPDSDAGDAVMRVPGVSVVEDKFVVIRGLPERYNNTLLNGTEMVSPEPTRRVVPMNVFPASLLESITTTKTARPDRPGDFAGGSVEITTKEFPDEFVMQLSASAGYNSLATFEQLPLVPWSGLDYLGIDDGKRAMPANPPDHNEMAPESFAEQYRSVWTPARTTAPPDLGLDFSLGGQIGETTPLGYSFSLAYSTAPSFRGGRLFRFFTSPDIDTQEEFGLSYDEAMAEVDWGAIGNFALRLGGASKLTLKNLYTRNAVESVISASGFEEEANRSVRLYQVKYVAQDVIQSQVAGEHFLGFFLDSRFDWRLTAAQANRDEPDNRQSTYVKPVNDTKFRLDPFFSAKYFARDLRDQTAAAQGDWTLPFSLRGIHDSQFKIGGLYRIKRRTFDAFQFDVRPPFGGTSPVLDTLPPELAYTPENLGGEGEGPLLMQRSAQLAQSYDADDNLAAAYVMVDVPIISWLRIVGGVRHEAWDLKLYPGGKPDSTEMVEANQRLEHNLLPSANITLRITDRMNVRLGAYQSLSRPDSREIADDVYISVTGQCSRRGNPTLHQTLIDNADVRWEFFPGIAELVSISGFYKRFDKPIVETVQIQGTNQCEERFANAREAVNYGGEFEFRKSLNFLPGLFGNLGVGGNFLLVESQVTFPELDDGSGLPFIGSYDPDIKLAGQSQYLVNAFLSYSAPSGSLSATVLMNYFDDRIVRYGVITGDDTDGENQLPNLEERGRATLDAKVQWSPNLRWTFSASGKNLTNNVVELFHRTSIGPAVVAESYQTGVEVKVGVGYAF